MTVQSTHAMKNATVQYTHAVDHKTVHVCNRMEHETPGHNLPDEPEGKFSCAILLRSSQSTMIIYGVCNLYILMIIKCMYGSYVIEIMHRLEDTFLITTKETYALFVVKCDSFTTNCNGDN